MGLPTGCDKCLGYLGVTSDAGQRTPESPGANGNICKKDHVAYSFPDPSLPRICGNLQKKKGREGGRERGKKGGRERTKEEGREERKAGRRIAHHWIRAERYTVDLKCFSY